MSSVKGLTTETIVVNATMKTPLAMFVNELAAVQVVVVAVIKEAVEMDEVPIQAVVKVKAETLVECHQTVSVSFTLTILMCGANVFLIQPAPIIIPKLARIGSAAMRGMPLVMIVPPHQEAVKAAMVIRAVAIKVVVKDAAKAMSSMITMLMMSNMVQNTSMLKWSSIQFHVKVEDYSLPC